MLDDYARERSNYLHSTGPVSTSKDPGFYDRMLFRKQCHLSGRFEYRQLGAANNPQMHQRGLHLHASVGLWNRLQAELNWSYAHNRLEFTPGSSSDAATARAHIGLVYRSYVYQPETGPGWDRDSQGDVAWGSLLQGGQFVTHVDLYPPVLSGPPEGDEIGFLSLSDLSSSHSVRVHLSGDCGLGRGLTIGLHDAETYAHSAIASRIYGANITGRVREWLFAGLDCSQTYQSGEYDEPAVALTLRIAV